MSARMRVSPVAACSSLLLAGLIAAAPAEAVPRFASPDGDGTACTEVAPCDIRQAINFAASGDDVTIGSGDYTLTGGSPADDLLVPPGVEVHGATGGPPPTISSNAHPVIETGANSEISDLRLIGTDPGGPSGASEVLELSGIGDRLYVREAAGSGTACLLENATMTNSVCFNDAGGVALRVGANPTPNTGTLQNVTVVARTAGPAMVANSFAPGNASATINATNTIVAATFSNSIDLRTATEGGTVEINLDHSNWDTENHTQGGTSTPIGSVTNQTDPPAFVSVVADDLHQTALSPTIDAGAGGAELGPFDLDLLPRVQGAAPDIGGYEFDSAPDTVITKRPRNRTTGRRAKFKFVSSEAGSSFRCAVDGRPFKRCGSPKSYRRLDRGKHGFKVKAVDSTSNVDPTPARDRWRIKPPG